MKRRGITLLLLMVALSAATGCGTMMNLDTSSAAFGMIPTQRVYGGIQSDVELADRNFQMASEGGGEGVARGVVGAYLLLVDLPLSLVGDTLTLPVTIPAAARHEEAERNRRWQQHP